MKKAVKLVGLCLVLIITGALMLGCSGTKIITKNKLPQSLNELSLIEMWNAVAAAGIEPVTRQPTFLKYQSWI